MPTLLRDSHFVLERYPAPAFIRLARTAEPLRSQAQATSSLQACRRALGELDVAAIGLLIDWRLCPSALEAEALQRAAARACEAFATQFGRTAVLLLTAASPEASIWSNDRGRVFHDEEAAIAYVTGP